MGDSFKQVSYPSMAGLEVVQPGLEPVYLQQLQHVKYAGEKLNESAVAGSRICGLRKVTFWLVIAVVALSAIVIGVGVGFGMGMNRSSGGASRDVPPAISTAATSPFASSVPGSPIPSSPATPTASSSSSSATTSTPASSSAPSSENTPTVSSICPGANNTIIRPNLGTVRYRVRCDSDFSGSGKKTLSSVVLPSFDACLAMCNTMNYFQGRADVGATYNVEGTGQQTPGTCWCLGGPDKEVVENVGNDAAVPL